MTSRFYAFCTFADLLIQAVRFPNRTVELLASTLQIERERIVRKSQIRAYNYMENERRRYRNQKLLDAIKEHGKANKNREES